MTHVIQSVLTTLGAAEWVSVAAARVLIGSFFCISAEPSCCTNPVSVREKTMVQIHVSFPYATALFFATVEFACGAA